MGTRYGRRSAGGGYEYHDSKESLLAAANEEARHSRAAFFGFIGLIAGGFLGYLCIQHAGGIDWPKPLRFAAVIAGGVGMAGLMAWLADAIWYTIVAVLMLAALWLIGSFVWDIV